MSVVDLFPLCWKPAIAFAASSESRENSTPVPGGITPGWKLSPENSTIPSE